jgi:cation transport ATPase
VILADRLDRVGEAIVIARRARRIAVESIVAGMGLSMLAMLAAVFGWLMPVPAAIVQEGIDVAVILAGRPAPGGGVCVARRFSCDTARRSVQLLGRCGR